MNQLAVKILTFEAEKCAGMAQSLKLTTEAGEIMILPNHASLIATINLADIEIVWNHTYTQRFIGRVGVVSVHNASNTASLLLADCDEIANITKTSLESYLETINSALKNAHLTTLQQQFYLDQKASLEKSLQLIHATV